MNETGFIDLRSDTVTRPTAAMRRAMAEAEVGDDVYGEDPTINRLERRAAEILGKQAALFVPSGTMGNTIGVKLHTRHGQEVICEARSHLLEYELAMLAWFSGCVGRPVRAAGGVLRWEQVKQEIRPLGPHRAPTALIELENTHNMAGGTVTPLEVMTEICDGAHNAGLKVHLDGARIFNAAAHLGTTVKDLCAGADTVMFCLSKGLCAPVGSLLAGEEEAIARGRLYRKRLGGGMRQAGVLAAAGLIALEEMPARLGEDHANARFMAEEMARIPAVRIVHRVETNLVIFDISAAGMAASELSRKLKERGVLINPIDQRLLRLATHHDAPRAACERALRVIEECLH
ncbi:MAG: aminotransferase class I/II-fold pyridoxal phosphate-dependent enzyme [Bryobacterales bacterium]|nr:aminotransferase class I/II-fold pyridoxal phosphate-dependent enzyme [Bryobacterales bacterium]